MLETERLEELERRIRHAEEANEASRRELANRRSELSPAMRRALWVLGVLALVLAAGAGSCGAACARAPAPFFCFPAIGS
jgi:hypothetical protein